METRHLLRTHAVEHFVLLEPKRAQAHLCADTWVGFIHGDYVWASIVPFRMRHLTSHLVGFFFETSVRLVSPQSRCEPPSRPRGDQSADVGDRQAESQAEPLLNILHLEVKRLSRGRTGQMKR